MITRSPFHLVEQRPWPLIISIRAFFIVSGLTAWFHGKPIIILIIGLLLFIVTVYRWWSNVYTEGAYIGVHTIREIVGIKIGIILFITSEIIFFFGFFWSFFHRSLRPTLELGCSWPPVGITPINPFSIPLLNTAVLLGSGVTITWAHHSILDSKSLEVTQGLLLTVVLGLYFTYLQAGEYLRSRFSISERVYGSTFFVITGFHGVHVALGTRFLVACLLRNILRQYSIYRHFSFEARAWYWHFVDVVWIILYLFIYWWGS